MQPEEIARKVRKSRAWDHDIKFVDGRFIEEVVLDFQKAHARGAEAEAEALLAKIVGNYAMYRPAWGKGFAQFTDSQEDGELLHDEIVWRCCIKFKTSNCLKEKGRAFNAYYVSACLHQMRNMKSSSEALKNYPRVPCPICRQEVPRINAAHLTHAITLDIYKKEHKNHALVSPDGTTVCPFSGKRIPELTEAIVNRHVGYYTVQDYVREFGDAERRVPFLCPVSGIQVPKIDAAYLDCLMHGYTLAEFVRDFPACQALVTCGISGERVTSVDQPYLDKVLKQKGRERVSLEEFLKSHPTVTSKARQEDVENPYTGKKVKEITLEMLRQARVTVKEHLERNATLFLNYNYPKYQRCPFTGKKLRNFTREYLVAIGKSVYDFYRMACKYPLRRWAVRCAVCGEWVPNIWDHLDQARHSYAPPTTMEEFEQEYGTGATRITISTNAYKENNEGESIHVADLVPQPQPGVAENVDLVDQLMNKAGDATDRKIAMSVGKTQDLDGIWHSVAKKNMIILKEPISSKDTTKSVSNSVASILGTRDFELAGRILAGKKEIEVLHPSKQTVKERLARMLIESDIGAKFALKETNAS